MTPQPPFTATDADLAQAAIERDRDHARQVREESYTRWIEAMANDQGSGGRDVKPILINTRAGLEDGVVVSTVDGREDLPDWAIDTDDYKAFVSAVHEVDQGNSHWIYLHCQEAEATLRVDLDRTGWKKLRDLCDAVLDRPGVNWD